MSRLLKVKLGSGSPEMSYMMTFLANRTLLLALIQQTNLCYSRGVDSVGRKLVGAIRDGRGGKKALFYPWRRER